MWFAAISMGLSGGAEATEPSGPVYPPHERLEALCEVRGSGDARTVTSVASRPELPCPEAFQREAGRVRVEPSDGAVWVHFTPNEVDDGLLPVVRTTLWDRSPSGHVGGLGLTVWAGRRLVEPAITPLSHDLLKIVLRGLPPLPTPESGEVFECTLLSGTERPFSASVDPRQGCDPDLEQALTPVLNIESPRFGESRDRLAIDIVVGSPADAQLLGTVSVGSPGEVGPPERKLAEDVVRVVSVGSVANTQSDSVGVYALPVMHRPRCTLRTRMGVHFSRFRDGQGGIWRASVGPRCPADVARGIAREAVRPRTGPWWFDNASRNDPGQRSVSYAEEQQVEVPLETLAVPEGTPADQSIEGPCRLVGVLENVDGVVRERFWSEGGPCSAWVEDAQGDVWFNAIRENPPLESASCTVSGTAGPLESPGGVDRSTCPARFRPWVSALQLIGPENTPVEMRLTLAPGVVDQPPRVWAAMPDAPQEKKAFLVTPVDVPATELAGAHCQVESWVGSWRESPQMITVSGEDCRWEHARALHASVSDWVYTTRERTLRNLLASRDRVWVPGTDETKTSAPIASDADCVIRSRAGLPGVFLDNPPLHFVEHGDCRMGQRLATIPDMQCRLRLTVDGRTYRAEPSSCPPAQVRELSEVLQGGGAQYAIGRALERDEPGPFTVEWVFDGRVDGVSDR